MNTLTLLNRLRNLAERFPRDDCPWEERPRFEARTNDDTLLQFQTELGGVLPAELLTFLRECDAIVAMGVNNGYWIGGVENLRGMIGESYFPSQIEGTMVCPVATDGCGDAFLIALETGHVWAWDHETGRVRQCFDSFDEFLAKIVEEWEHTLANS